MWRFKSFRSSLTKFIYRTSVTKDSAVAAKARHITYEGQCKVQNGLLAYLVQGHIALTNAFLVFSFYHCILSMIFIIKKYITRTTSHYYYLYWLWQYCVTWWNHRESIFGANNSWQTEKIVPSKRQVPSGAEAYSNTWRHRKRRQCCTNTEQSDTMNKWSTFHTFTIYWGQRETVAG